MPPHLFVSSKNSMFDWFKPRPAPPAQPATPPSPAAPAATPVESPPVATPPVATPAMTPTVANPPSTAPAATPPAATPLVATPSAVAPLAPVPAAAAASWTDRLKAGLARTRQAVGFNRLFASKLDEASLEALETALLSADAGVPATTRLIGDLRARWKNQGGETGPATPKALLRDAVADLLRPLEAPLVIGTQRPFVIMLAGVNGAGKTTSIGKLAKYFQQQGLSVLLAAGDTFRAAAREQLAVWGERNNVMVISQEGGDPAAVMFDAVQAAKSRGIDIVLADTAGRLPTQLHLMDELKKIRRVIAKADPGAPHEVLLVLDGNTGQNALGQLKAFDAALGVTGIVLTKLDGSAKGGVIAAIAQTQPTPLRFIGVGERVDDLRPFAARDFSAALLDD